MPYYLCPTCQIGSQCRRERMVCGKCLECHDETNLASHKLCHHCSTQNQKCIRCCRLIECGNYYSDEIGPSHQQMYGLKSREEMLQMCRKE